MIEAVAAILIHGDEIFAIKRQPHLRAFPGYYAFPGGKIDDGDVRHMRQDIPLLDHPDIHMNALVRELSEELAFDLEAALNVGDVREISLFGTAITPAFERVRFNAYYYKIVLETKPVFELDDNEISDGYWDMPEKLCKRYLDGQALMVVPMRNALFRLAQSISAANCEPFNIETPAGELACIELIDGLRTFPIPSNTLPPANTTNALLLGDEGEPQVLVDPSPASDKVYARLIKTLSARLLDAIFISHHHPDHHECAFVLAREKGIPLLMSRITRERIENDFGVDYIASTQIKLVEEGFEITRWKEQAVRAYELPGHDDGMLGLAPDNLAWFFVADLVQNPGSIAIPDEGGDLAVYLESLQRVIGLKPNVILPSHGIASGGTEILQQTVAHRMQREQQIRPLFLAGASVDTILDSLYPDLDAALISLARQTIRQHVRKLEADAKRSAGRQTDSTLIIPVSIP